MKFEKYNKELQSRIHRYTHEECISDKNHPMYDSAILSEVKLDFTSFDGITYLKRYNGYIFDVNGTTIMLKGYPANDNKWEIKFGPFDGKGGISNTDMKDWNDTKVTIEIVKQVSKCLYLFMKQYNPTNVRFGADRKSRQKMYERVVSILIHRSEFITYDLKSQPSGTGNSVHYEIYKKKKGTGLSEIWG